MIRLKQLTGYLTGLIEDSEGALVDDRWNNLHKMSELILELQREIHTQLYEVNKESYRNYVDKELGKRIRRDRDEKTKSD